MIPSGHERSPWCVLTASDRGIPHELVFIKPSTKPDCRIGEPNQKLEGGPLFTVTIFGCSKAPLLSWRYEGLYWVLTLFYEFYVGFISLPNPHSQHWLILVINVCHSLAAAPWPCVETASCHRSHLRVPQPILYLVCSKPRHQAHTAIHQDTASDSILLRHAQTYRSDL